MKKRNQPRGFTLVEIAIVLVIIGLLLGGILKGQELINNAKVRAIADRQNSLKVAWFSFIDRYQGIPGDFPRASQFIPGTNQTTSTGPGKGSNGNGDGVVGDDSGAVAGDDVGAEDTESVLAMQHLTGAGYLRCSQCTADVVGPSTASNSLTNSYGGTMMILNTDSFYTSDGTGEATQSRLAVLTGGQMPSNILAEVDRKIDDGNPYAGDFVLSTATTSGAAVSTNAQAAPGDAVVCTYFQAGQEGGQWNNGQSAAIQPNCGAAVFI